MPAAPNFAALHSRGGAPVADATLTEMCQTDNTLYSEEQAKSDYNARLGYGTDQGRWLVQQVGDKESAGRRPSRVPSRVFHDIDAEEAPPVATSSSEGAKDDSKPMPSELQRFVRRYTVEVMAVAGVTLVLVGLLVVFVR